MVQDVASAIKTYHYLSERWFTHASPTLFNAGTPRPQLSSCFLVAMKNDSIEVSCCRAAPCMTCLGKVTLSDSRHMVLADIRYCAFRASTTP